jgi:hypothetical protein
MPQPSVERLINPAGHPDLSDDIDRIKREEIIYFIEVSMAAVSAGQENQLGLVEFDQLLEQAFVWGYDREDEVFKFDLEEALNYLVLCKILAHDELDIENEDGSIGVFRLYYMLVSQYLH